MRVDKDADNVYLKNLLTKIKRDEPVFYEELQDMMNRRYCCSPVINPTATEQAKIQKGTETNMKGEQL